MKLISKSERGVISVMVLLSILFFLAVLMGGFTINSVKRKSQLKNNKEIMSLYQMDEADYYDNLIEKNRVYTDKNGQKAIIPGGFYVSKVESEQTISDGLVVKDKDGNEYVWIPITDKNSFARKNFTTSQLTITQTTDTINNFKESALKYGGFYIGRYEAGIQLDTQVTLSTNPKNNDVKPIIRPNTVVWNFVSQTKAKEVSAKFKEESTTVTSSLMNSLAWDTVCSWLESKGNNVQTDSSNFGNYTNSSFDYSGACLTNGTTLSNGPGTKANGISAILATKTSNKNMKNNICDIAGNVAEYTTEVVSGSSTEVVKRGGAGNVNGNIEPAGYRKKVDKSNLAYDTGFRIVIAIGKYVQDDYTVNSANVPNLSGFNENQSYYVKWDLNEGETEYIIDEKKVSENDEPHDWYDYSAGINKYANLKTTGGGNDCYWVWIPRYAYCITEGYHSDIPGTIDIKFLKDTTNNPVDGSKITISNKSGSGNWNVHPAFWFDKNNNGIEEENEKLTGIWVAKFEASSSNVNEINLVNGTFTGDTESLNGNGGGANTDFKVRIKPNVTSWRGLSSNYMFDISLNIINPGNSLCGTGNTKNIQLDSHMMKNIDWGAVAYISSSRYGKTDGNGNRIRVYSNPYVINQINCSAITGLSGITATQTNDGTMNDLYKYNTLEGVEASTTGNIYGVYDMVGGTWECMSAIFEIGTVNSSNNKLFSESNRKYVDRYKKNPYFDLEDLNFYEDLTRYGDAIYETSREAYLPDSSWEGRGTFIAGVETPVFGRGGLSYDLNGGSMFSFHNFSGEANLLTTFRPVVVNLN